MKSIKYKEYDMSIISRNEKYLINNVIKNETKYYGTFPLLFVNGHCIGDYNHVQKIEDIGKLNDILL